MLFSSRLRTCITGAVAGFFIATAVAIIAQTINFNIFQTEVTPGAPSAVLVGSPGNCTIGPHNFSVTFITAGGETNASNASGQVLCTAASGQVTVTIPLGGKLVTGRNIYASKIDDANSRFLVAASPVVSNNTSTSYTFNTADSSLLSIPYPTSNTANNIQWTFKNNGDLVATNADTSEAATSTIQSQQAVFTQALSVTDIYTIGTIKLGHFTLISNTAPTITSGFGASPAIVGANGTATFRVDVGSGGAATSGVLGFPLTAGWNCVVQDMTTNIATRASVGSTNSVTVTAASAWTANDILVFLCDARR